VFTVPVPVIVEKQYEKIKFYNPFKANNEFSKNQQIEVQMLMMFQLHEE